MQHPWRIALIVAVLLVVANLGVLLLSVADTKRGGRIFPTTVDEVVPQPGELIRPQDTITADLRSDLTGVLLIDGQEVPEDQLTRVIPLGVVSFRPGTDKDLERFGPGNHSVVVEYWLQGKERPTNPGTYSWSFRVGA